MLHAHTHTCLTMLAMKVLSLLRHTLQFSESQARGRVTFLNSGQAPWAMRGAILGWWQQKLPHATTTTTHSSRHYWEPGAPHEFGHILAVVTWMLQSIMTNHDPFCHWSRSGLQWLIQDTVTPWYAMYINQNITNEEMQSCTASRLTHGGKRWCVKPS